MAREQVHAAIDQGMRPVEIVRQIGRALDDLAAKCAPTACARGCGWCCHQRVDVTAPEIFALAEHLRGDESVRARLGATAAALAGLSSRAHHLRRVRCSLLNDAMECSAHSERPLACRRGHSLDATTCRAVYDDPTLATQIPADSTRSWNTAALILGYREGYAHHQRALDTYELNAGLLIALEDDTCESRWSSGEDVLAAARTHSSDEIAQLLGAR